MMFSSTGGRDGRARVTDRQTDRQTGREGGRKRGREGGRERGGREGEGQAIVIKLYKLFAHWFMTTFDIVATSIHLVYSCILTGIINGHSLIALQESM